MDKPDIAVIGAGLMGHGITYLFAAAGYEVRVQDPAREALDKLPQRIREICDLIGIDRATVERVSTGLSIEWAVSGVGIVIEAAPEKLALKQAIFADLERFAPKDAILASNTSALPIAHIAAGRTNRDRIVGAHFWNPPHLVPLVEIVLMSEANRPAGDRLAAVLRAIGRRPVFVHRDIPGFIGNRLQHALKREAIALVAAGVSISGNVCGFVVGPQSNGAAPPRQITIARNRITFVHGLSGPRPNLAVRAPHAFAVLRVSQLKGEQRRRPTLPSARSR